MDNETTPAPYVCPKCGTSQADEDRFHELYEQHNKYVNDPAYHGIKAPPELRDQFTEAGTIRNRRLACRYEHHLMPAAAQAGASGDAEVDALLKRARKLQVAYDEQGLALTLGEAMEQVLANDKKANEAAAQRLTAKVQQEAEQLAQREKNIKERKEAAAREKDHPSNGWTREALQPAADAPQNPEKPAEESAPEQATETAPSTTAKVKTPRTKKPKVEKQAETPAEQPDAAAA